MNANISMKKNARQKCTLLSLIIISSLAFSLLGNIWRSIYYPDEPAYSPSNLPLATAMRAIHDGTYISYFTGEAPKASFSFINNGTQLLESMATQLRESDLAAVAAMSDEARAAEARATATYDFTTAGDDYFEGACFIGDSRTVGISMYSGIENAVFLCRTSLSIYDYDKPKIVYDGKRTSIKDVLSQNQFAKIYIMLGINETGGGTSETFFNSYRDVVADIRALQPDAIIFIQGNLLVTAKKSNTSGIKNEKIMERNAMIATLANKRDIFYIDINESSLCENGSLVPAYTWDQVHIRAQYYPIWKEFLLNHAIIK